MKEETAPKMSSSTPSPTASTSAGSSVSRRPPRKSTLTQQQKNQKRQRATQDQLATLEVEFNKNPTPTALVRERIAQEINMTERSVQIWFQNRRAKIKLLAKKSFETGEDCDAIPDSMRQYLALQAMESGKPLASRFLAGRHGPVSYSGSSFDQESGNQAKVVIQHFQCRSLSIGTWRRVGQAAMDLVIFYSPDKAVMTYYINNDSAGYKIEYPFSYIKNITLDPGDPTNPQKPGGLVIELLKAPDFFMDSSGSGGFYQCGDFTEDMQASHILVHNLGGQPKNLSVQLAKLVSLESFHSRFNQFEAPGLSASAPVSPGVIRPASQPDVHSRQHHLNQLFQESHFGLQPGRGHKRTRSRSVPIAMDFSMLQHPMPSFHFHQEPSTQMANPNIYAPVPQHLQNLGPSLRIDTSTGYGMDFRQYPLSAATTTSPSDYNASPSFFTSSAHPDSLQAANYQHSYSLPFLSPMPENASMVHAASPLSQMSHADPVIANQSPPLSSMHHSGSADLFSMSHDHSNLSDDGLALSELYSKQTLNLPMHSPGMDGSPDDMDMQHMYGTIDPASLSPEN